MDESTKNHYTPIIGLEIHVELRTKSKMFCGCPADHFGVEPNTHVCPVCLGLPGALPVANAEAIRRAIKIGLALDCEIAKDSKFDRKNYFYPDLPKGYQISQYDEPFCLGGQLTTKTGTVRITRVHLEEDTGKLQHVTLTPEEQQAAGVQHAQVSLIDFNRSSVPLVEIVTEPDIHSGAQAREFAKNLVQILRYLEVSDCDMEKGSLRLEANISVQTPEEAAAGTLPPYKIEVKNLNSFRFLERAINYEIARHSELREKGEIPKQETRGWNDSKGQTYSQRSKEEAEDYRYFPDPDLPPMHFEDEFIEEIRAELPELPAQVKTRFLQEYGVSEQAAEIFTASARLSNLAEELFIEAKNQQLPSVKIANAVTNKRIETWLLDETQLMQATEEAGRKEIHRIISQYSELFSLNTISQDEVLSCVKQVLNDPKNTDIIEKYRGGKTSILGLLIGEVRRLNPNLDPSQIKELILANI